MIAFYESLVYLFLPNCISCFSFDSSNSPQVLRYLIPDINSKVVRGDCRKNTTNWNVLERLDLHLKASFGINYVVFCNIY